MSVYQPHRTVTAGIWAALAVSLALHGLAVFGLPSFSFPQRLPPQEPLEVRLGALQPQSTRSATAAKPVAPLRASAPRHRPAPRRQTTAALSAAPPAASPIQIRPAEPAPPETVAARIPPPASQELAAAADSLSGASSTAPPPTAPAPSGPAPSGSAPSTPVTNVPVTSASVTSTPSPADESSAGEQSAAGQPAHYPFKEVELEFDLLYGAVPMRLGSVIHRLRIEGDHYAIEEVGEGRGLIGGLYQRVIGGRFIQRSAGTIGPGGFAPDEFFAQRGRAERRERAAFNWTEGWVALFSRGNERKLALAPGTQDVVSMVHQLFFMQPLPRTGRLVVATGRKVGDYAFEVLGREQVDTGLGTLDALHVQRLDPDGDRVELWLDPARDMLPVRIYSAYRDGLVLDFVLKRSSVKQ